MKETFLCSQKRVLDEVGVSKKSAWPTLLNLMNYSQINLIRLKVNAISVCK